MEKNKNSGSTLARKMAVSLVCGLAAGFAFMMLREKLVASGNSGIWQTINDLLFQDITTEGAERADFASSIGRKFIKAHYANGTLFFDSDDAKAIFMGSRTQFIK